MQCYSLPSAPSNSRGELLKQNRSIQDLIEDRHGVDRPHPSPCPGAIHLHLKDLWPFLKSGNSGGSFWLRERTVDYRRRQSWLARMCCLGWLRQLLGKHQDLAVSMEPRSDIPGVAMPLRWVTYMVFVKPNWYAGEPRLRAKCQKEVLSLYTRYVDQRVQSFCLLSYGSMRCM